VATKNISIENGRDKSSQASHLFVKKYISSFYARLYIRMPFIKSLKNQPDRQKKGGEAIDARRARED